MPTQTLTANGKAGNVTTKWYYAKGTERHGPVTEEQLHRLAATGKLQPSDLVWRKGMAQWQQAESIQGLFPPQPMVKGATQATQPAETPVDWRLHLQKPLVIVLSFLFCWPVGLVLVGIHPRISPKTKKIVFGCVGSLVVIVMILGGLASSVAYKQAVEANALWENGKQEEAVAIYESLVAGDNGGMLPDSMKPTVYGRLIDHEASAGNLAGATNWVARAGKFRVIPKIRSEQAQRLVASLEEAKRQEKQLAQATSADPTGRPSKKPKSGPSGDTLASVKNSEFVATSTLYREFNTNVPAADEKYKGKTIFVAGEVHSVDKAFLVGTILNLTCNDYGSFGVLCVLSRSAARSNELKTINAGDYVKVRGTCEGKMITGTVKLTDCEFVRLEP